jgi:hypothetical protein
MKKDIWWKSLDLIRKYFNVAKGANMSVKIHANFGYKITPPRLISMHHFLF